ncbi:hypothetical protein [Porphyromonas sp. oral taxon 275]|uniref:hypothetical protein n=1 Tax=Porphyromonas sp. oral taxon 275 TaxID=712435 RepID=UPI001BA7F55D|nr:hypothetical protein [Porphyromonas sp. oral taxon 275]QUB42365.1 hypothetical protein J4862_04990 [Porphyromonas sp. oral taxon 275]
MEAFGYSNKGRKLISLREVTLRLSKTELDRLIEFLKIVRSGHQEIALEIREQGEEINPDEPVSVTHLKDWMKTNKEDVDLVISTHLY